MFGIDMGPSQQENTQYSNLTSAGGFATGQGESDINASGTFMRNVLSGDPTKIASSLAPEISAGQKQVQQQKNQDAQFGTRSGGSTASTASAEAGNRANIINLVGGLQSKTADSLSSTGSNLLSTGVNADATAFGEAGTLQKQRQAQLDDIFNSSANLVSGFATGFAGA